MTGFFLTINRRQSKRIDLALQIEATLGNDSFENFDALLENIDFRKRIFQFFRVFGLLSLFPQPGFDHFERFHAAYSTDPGQQA